MDGNGTPHIDPATGQVYDGDPNRGRHYENTQPPPRQSNPQYDNQKMFFARMYKMMAESGCGWNQPLHVMKRNDKDMPEQIVTTPAQLIQNLTDSIDELSSCVAESCELAEEQLSTPKRRRRS